MAAKRTTPKAPANAGAVPAGWGFAPAKDAPATQPSSGQLYDFDPGSFAAHAGNSLFRHFQVAGFVEQIELFEESADPVHLWRAWRTARCMGEMPAAMLSRLTPHLDALAKAGHVAPSVRVAQAENRDSAIRSYYSLLDANADPTNRIPKRTKTAIRKMVAKSHNTTDGTLKGWIIEYERNAGSE